MIERDTEIVFMNVATASVSLASYTVSGLAIEEKSMTINTVKPYSDRVRSTIAVPRGRVAKPRDSYVEDNGRTSVFPKFQNEQDADVKNTPTVLLPKKNHDSVMSRIDMEFLPPQLPPFYPFEKVYVEPMVPFKVTISMHPLKSPNASSAKVHYCVASTTYN